MSDSLYLILCPKFNYDIPSFLYSELCTQMNREIREIIMKEMKDHISVGLFDQFKDRFEKEFFDYCQ